VLSVLGSRRRIAAMGLLAVALAAGIVLASVMILLQVSPSSTTCG
jgi:hypothetical protein